MDFFRQNSLRLAWLIALVSMLGSLYFSEIAGYAPCMLCWYQRICMYPLTVILLVGLLRRDSNVIYYALPLVYIGAAIGAYHNLLYYNILPQAEATCRFGISCTTKFIEWAGFITIPLLSLTSFVAIAGLLLLAKKNPPLADES